MGRIRRFMKRLAETEEDILNEESREWAESVPDTVRLNVAPNRQKVRVAAQVRRITVRPGESGDTLEVLCTDGTGELKAAWTGRRSIPGLQLGTKLVFEGVIGEERGGRRMVNPRFEFG